MFRFTHDFFKSVCGLDRMSCGVHDVMFLNAKSVGVCMKGWLKRQLILHGGLAGALAMGFVAGYSSQEGIDAYLTNVRCRDHPVEIGFFEDPAGLSLESRVNAHGRTEVYLVHESGVQSPVPHDVFEGRSWAVFEHGGNAVDCGVLDAYSSPIAHYCTVCEDDRVLSSIKDAIGCLEQYESLLPRVEHPQGAEQFYAAAAQASALLDESESLMASAYARVLSMREEDPSFPLMPDCARLYEKQSSRLRYAREQGVRSLD